MREEDRKAKKQGCRRMQKGNESQQENRIQQRVVNIKKNALYIQHITNHFIIRFTIAQSSFQP
jgi:hypothetical protein